MKATYGKRRIGEMETLLDSTPFDIAMYSEEELRLTREMVARPAELVTAVKLLVLPSAAVRTRVMVLSAR